MSREIKTVIHDDDLGKVAVVTTGVSDKEFEVRMHDVDNSHALLSKSLKEGSQHEFHTALRENREHYLEESDSLN